jgi:Fic family protein
VRSNNLLWWDESFPNKISTHIRKRVHAIQMNKYEAEPAAEKKYQIGRIKGGAIMDHVPPRERRLVAVEK